MKIKNKLCFAAAFVFLLAALLGITNTVNKYDSSESRDLIVLFSNDAKDDEIHSMLSILPSGSLQWFEHNTALLRVSEKSAERWLSFFRASSVVSAVDFDAPITLSSISEDAYSNAQWPLDNTGAYNYISDMSTAVVLSTEDVDLNMPEAWALYDTLNHNNTREVIVAVIDTGVDINHPDLSANIWCNEGEIPGDGLDNDNNGYIDDINGWDFYNNDASVCHYATDGIHVLATDKDDHGTHVAGIIAAAKDNAVGIAGVASCVDVKILPLKIHGGENGNGSISNAIRAIHYATAMGADICNISWGTTQENKALKAAIAESDMLVIAAAGNSGDNTDKTPIYPACFDLNNILSVTFIDANGVLSPKGNYGKSSIDIAAPGVHIYSTLVGGYGSLSGSSMAVPHVSGIAALLYAQGTNQYPANIKKIILNTRKPLESLTGKIKNAGIPDAFAAINAFSSIKYDMKKPTLSISNSFADGNLLLTVTGKDSGGSGIRTIRYASGAKALSDFRHGTTDTAIQSGESFALKKAGKYTFYVSDYAGNERTYIYSVKDDTTAPLLTASYQVAFNKQSFPVALSVSDEESGIRQVFYAEGVHSTDYFTAGNGIPIAEKNNTYSITLNKTGIYTFFAIDHRGNKTIIHPNITIVPSTSLKLNYSARTLKVGDSFLLKTTLSPAKTTDKVQFRSSLPSVCNVSSKGKVTAKSVGNAVITVTTASGISKKCKITVTK